MKIIKDKEGYTLWKKGNTFHLTLDEAYKFSEKFERDCEKAAEEAEIEWGN